MTEPNQSVISALGAIASSEVSTLLESDVKDVWLSDSGATNHITFRREWFSTFTLLDKSYVELGDNRVCEVKGTGTVAAKSLINSVWLDVNLNNVLYVPNFKKNLFSVGVCTTKKLDVIFNHNTIEVLKGNEVILRGIKQNNNICRLLLKPIIASEANLTVSDSLQTWHERLGHINQSTLKDMTKKDLVNGVKFSKIDDFFCKGCQFGKSYRLPFRQKNTSRNVLPCEFIHSDVMGPMSTESLGGARFCVVFKDDNSAFRCVYFMRHKSDVFEYFKE